MRKYYIGISSLIVGILIGFFIQPVISEDNIYNEMKKFQDVFYTAPKNYVEEVDTHKLIESAIRGMLSQLDPHSVYIDANDIEHVNEDMQGSFEGIGIEFDIVNDTITVVSPIPGRPSDQLGMMSGDKIVKIDNNSAVGLDRSEVPKKLKGPKGTKVIVDVLRTGSRELIHYEIIRDKIPINSIETAFMFDGTSIGLIRLSRFAETTHNELVDAAKELKSEGMKKLILDLRGNPGGYLNQAVQIADEIVPGGHTIVYTKSRRPEFDEYYTSTSGGMLENMPVIILIDAGSASASEIVSGAVQDLDRGLIMGMTSFGKGLVQRQYQTGDGSAHRLTISKYYTPSGRCIQRPFEDKDAYRHLVGRLELSEGENIYHTLDKIKKEHAEKKDTSFSLDSIPMFKTRSGRAVLGGGGIIPDYIVKYDTITPLSLQLRNKNLFFYFVNGYMESDGENLRNHYKSSFESFIRKFPIDENLISQFRKYSEGKDVKWNDTDFKTDEQYIKTSLKANFARAIWDRSKFLEIYYADDKMVNSALKLFPEAEKISQLK